MNGAETLLHTLVRGGVTTCFGNPGTSEVHFVKGLDTVPEMRCVLALAENVATGAADGFSRISGGTAATLLHCGPGLANGLSNLHNAQKAGSSIVNVVGDQAQFHAPLNPPLASETLNYARTVSAWTRQSKSSLSVGTDAATAIAQARSGGGAIASLILPSDVCWGPGGSIGTVAPFGPRPSVPDEAVSAAASLAGFGSSTAFILGDDALCGDAPRFAAAIAAKTGAIVLAHSFIRRVERGGDRPLIERVPYAVPPAQKLFADIRNVVLVGAQRPVFAFAGPDGVSGPEVPGTLFSSLGAAGDDIEGALREVSARLGCELLKPESSWAWDPIERAHGEISSLAFGQSLAALMPEDCIVVDEGVTFGRSAYGATHCARRHDWLQLTGGAIGSGLPLATGAAIAAPQRRVVSLQADGSGLYTVQALWTQARERLDITTVVFSNRKYEILFNEMKRMGVDPGASADKLFSLENPSLDWVRIAQGFGVEAATACTMDEFNDLFLHSLTRSGPFLIELQIPN
ncbi:acetolactate synthase large subunit [Ottowia thiooxydans]|uniref:acetolactate synthase large subunit n=1 Tax=Ottowia thiooxydans TaxID=219182 RepID=UPI00040B358A|nr:acetolactate synthase large subunit [Ottowia thiooxydans]